ncbi:DNA polymerase III subunit alpha [Escherichia coli]|uniref:DNA polymerase III subunit alpha n=1 Tax=Escherichia coli TaxID=562 RepID=A0A2X3KF04_ECOLX|nr:DNA polymerase III subunit alpha [Escherichia coli]
MLQRSETTAVFQLESRGMKDLIKRLQPDCFEDMIALVALFRPGPLQSGMVDNFIDRKHGREEISYPDVQWQHESLKPVLEPTYGIILYQEQVMADCPGAFWLYPRWRGYAASCDGGRKSRKRWLSNVLYLLKVQKRTESTLNWR